MVNIDFELDDDKTVKEKILKDLKELVESGEIDIDKYFHLKSLV